MADKNTGYSGWYRTGNDVTRFLDLYKLYYMRYRYRVRNHNTGCTLMRAYSRYCHLAWTHMVILFTTVQAYLVLQTLQYGMVWYIFAMSIITINDIAAYMCGFFFGSRPLILLSPKKTLEGFIGRESFKINKYAIFMLLYTVFRIRFQIGSGFRGPLDPDSESGFGSRGLKKVKNVTYNSLSFN